jgi:hypothetical protein
MKYILILPSGPGATPEPADEEPLREQLETTSNKTVKQTDITLRMQVV